MEMGCTSVTGCFVHLLIYASHIERETMEIFLTSIQSIVPIIVIIILGYFLQVRGWFQESFGNDLSKLIMNVAMPVAIFTSVLKYLTLDKLISLSSGLLYTFIAFILGYLMAFIAVKLFGVRPGRRGTMINTFVNGNTIFIGLPLNIALFGDQALPLLLGVLYYKYGLYLDIRCLSNDLG